MSVIIIIIALVLLFIVVYNCTKYDRRGFDRKGIHKNGTKYDCLGYDADGYDRDGYNQKGYNQEGRNAKGQYNRFFDVHNYKMSQYSKDGFYNPKWYPIIVTNHAKQRMIERMPKQNMRDAEHLAHEAYCYGKSKRQVKKSSAILIEEIENRYEDSVLLIYQGYIYIFSKDNKLITVYKNERILL